MGYTNGLDYGQAEPIRFGEYSGNAFYFYGEVDAVEVPTTIKQAVGRELVQKSIPARDDLDWAIRIKGILTGELNGITVAQEVTALRALNDNQTHTYSDWDSARDGTYSIVPGTLRIYDDPLDDPNITNPRRFECNLIEWNQ